MGIDERFCTRNIDVESGYTRIARDSTTSANVGPNIIGYLDQTSTKDSNSIREESEKLGCDIYKYFAGQTELINGTYLSDVITVNSTDAMGKLLKYLESAAQIYKRGLFFFVLHNSHIHVIHDCAYSTRSCRCKWKTHLPKTLGELRPRLRQAPSIGSFTKRGWGQVIAYFSALPRRGVYLSLGGRRRRLPDGNEYLLDSFTTNTECSEITSMETCGLQGQSELQREEREQNSTSFGTDETRYTKAMRQLRRSSRKEILADKIESMIYKYPTSPIDSICCITEWLYNDDLKHIRADHREFKMVLDLVEKRFTGFTLKDFLYHYNDKHCIPKFRAINMPYDELYYDIATSISIIEKLLMYQFNDDNVAIDYFLRSIYNVLERRIPKLNTIIFHGDKSAGKSYFIDCITNYLLCSGEINTPLNKYGQFALMDCSGKRVIVWDEPNYEKCKVEELKKLLGGGQLKVQTKFKNDQVVNRTPIFITTNNHLSIFDDINFSDRLRVFRWRSCDFLKEYEKYPNPLCVMPLFKHYNILDNNYNYIE